MSKYEWEAGEVAIPARAWPAFRRALVEEWNRLQLRVLVLADDAYDSIWNSPRPDDALTAWLFPAADRHPGAYRHQAYEEREQHADAIRRLVFAWNDAVRAMVLRRPLKANLELKPVGRGAVMSFADATITLDETAKVVRWAVAENNHSVEHARRHPMAKALFAALERITWSRGSGGEIVGNDEYNQSDVGAGRGANYVTRSFGPRGSSKLSHPRRA